MTERELERRAQHRLAVLRHAEEVSGQRRGDVPLLRDQPAVLLQVAAPLRGRRLGGAEGPLAAAAPLTRRPPRPRWSGRSSSCASTTTSARRRSRCTWSATTTSRSAPPGCGGS